MQQAASGQADRLLARIARGDREAMRQLYDAEAPRLMGIARRLLRDGNAASDAVHDTFVQVWQNAARFDPQHGAAGAWLTGILRYRALDLARSRGRESLEPLEEEELTDERPDALARLLAKRETEALARCIGALEQRSRKAILLAFVDGCSHSQIAVVLDSRLGTVKAWIRRGLASLKGCLEP